MDSLLIQKTEDTPQVNFDIATGIFKLSGRSLPENAIDFYKPVLDWIEAVLSESHEQKFVFEIKLEYFNTASSKQLAKMLLLIERFIENNSIIIRWFYEKEDNDMLISGNQYSKFLKLEFEFIEY
ncbi:MAG: DUF1987 domain-containing protein [Bacteroidales bacterium]|jgi:hypothetical protein|nr:DUF1987 domain-containing protein [Bacteroidales bacterium]NLK82009.1 DUF1987 domain-containing protein [Bacteroidales bacterium]HPY82563.1 DUF1987 domain-containing protein [Bacteroidales bacterium]